ncbi:hypothetical protein MPB2EB_0776 [Mycoavidus sp. B2-EB]|nr:hypothetical protein MPB2EB_0776 [Mycoavidus sp. B2-EB]
MKKPLGSGVNSDLKLIQFFINPTSLTEQLVSLLLIGRRDNPLRSLASHHREVHG